MIDGQPISAVFDLTGALLLADPAMAAIVGMDTSGNQEAIVTVYESNSLKVSKLCMQ